MATVEELYDEVVEEKLVDQMSADPNEIDEEKEFIKKAELKFELVKISPEQIDRKTVWGEKLIYQGHPMPYLISAGSLPMIHLRDANMKPQKNIVNVSCMEYYDDNLQKLFIIANSPELVKVEEVEEEEVEEKEYEVPRALQGLAKLVDDARENINEIMNPTYFTKKKKNRLMRDRKIQFLNRGADQMAVAIVQHIDSLVKVGKFPIHMFGDFKKFSAGVTNARSDKKIEPLLDLILCAEVVIPSQEELTPRKRIDTALPNVGAGG